jgi:hypothetical protein
MERQGWYEMTVTKPCVECECDVTLDASKVTIAFEFLCTRCNERIETEKQLWFNSFTDQLLIGESK